MTITLTFSPGVSKATMTTATNLVTVINESGFTNQDKTINISNFS